METTLTLRNRLGFNEVTLWKQFCARRLHLIHTLSLNLRKASEQEEQVRVLAAELCAEYGFGPNAQCDFEKLLIAGIQSVRRNQKRSARHPHGYSESRINAENLRQQQGSDDESISNDGNAVKNSNSSQVVTPLTPMGTHSHSHETQYFDSNGVADPGGQGTSSHNWNSREARPQSSDHPNERHPPGGPLATPMFQSLVVRLEVLRDMIGAGAATWIESSAAAVAQMSAYGVLSTAVATAAVHGKLTPEEATTMRDSILNGPLLNSLRLAINPGLTNARILERVGALAASLVHGPHLLSALQALCVSLAQASHGSESDMRFMLKPLARSDPDAEVQLNKEKKLAAEKRVQELQSAEHEHAAIATATTQPKVLAHGLNYEGNNRPQNTQHQHPANESGELIGPQQHPYQAQLMHPQLIQQPLVPQPVLFRQAHPNDTHGAVHPMQQTIPSSVPFMIQNPGQSSMHILGSNTVSSGVLASQPQQAQHHHQPHHPPQQPLPPQPVPQQQPAQQQQQHDSKTLQKQSQASIDSTDGSVSTDSTNSQQRSGNLDSRSPALTPVDIANPALGFHVTGPDRMVTLECNNRTLKLTYSPLKSNPPTLSEIIDNARQSFAIPPSVVVRVKDVQRNKIIETNSELIDAFTFQQVKLSLLLPPPMLLSEPRPMTESSNRENEMRFTMLAPIFRTST